MIEYDYTGAAFTTVNLDPANTTSTDPWSPFTMPAAVSGSVFLDSALAPNMTGQTVTPADFDFGVMLNYHNVFWQQGTASFQFWTSSAGEITGWNVALTGGNNAFGNAGSPFYKAAQLDMSGDTWQEHLYRYDCKAPPGAARPCYTGSESNTVHGAWVVQAPEIDPQSGFASLSICLLALAVIMGRKKR